MIQVNERWYVDVDPYCYHLYEYRINDKIYKGSVKAKNYGKYILYRTTYHPTIKQVLDTILERETAKGVRKNDASKAIQVMREIEEKFDKFMEAYKKRVNTIQTNTD